MDQIHFIDFEIFFFFLSVILKESELQLQTIKSEKNISFNMVSLFTKNNCYGLVEQIIGLFFIFAVTHK